MVQVIQGQLAPSMGQAFGEGLQSGMTGAMNLKLSEMFEQKKNAKVNKELFGIESGADPKLVLQKMKMQAEYGADNSLSNILSGLYGSEGGQNTTGGSGQETTLEPTSPKVVKPPKDFDAERKKLDSWYNDKIKQPGLGKKQKDQLLEHFKIKKQDLDHQEDVAFRKSESEKKTKLESKKFTKAFVNATYNEAKNAQLGLSDLQDMAKIREKGNLGPWKGGKTSGIPSVLGGPAVALGTQVWNRMVPQGFEIMSQEEATDRADYDAFQQRRMADLRQNIFPRMTNIDVILSNEKYLPNSNMPNYVNRAREKNVEKMYKAAASKAMIFEQLKDQYGGEIPDDIQQQVESQLLEELKKDMDATKPEYKVKDELEHLPQPDEVQAGSIFNDGKGNRLQSNGKTWIKLGTK